MLFFSFYHLSPDHSYIFHGWNQLPELVDAYQAAAVHIPPYSTARHANIMSQLNFDIIHRTFLSLGAREAGLLFDFQVKYERKLRARPSK